MALNPSMERYAENSFEDLKAFIRALCVIPAPSHHEEKRVVFVQNWLERIGAQHVFVDDAKNVIWPLNDTGSNELVVFMAHTDVVFPDTEPLPFREENGRYYCPGVGDDTAQLAVLLFCARYFLQQKLSPKTGILIVANSCEEGLGNLKGSRAIVDAYGDRIREFITIDGGLRGFVNQAVGSHRYRVTVRTEGGHSYGAFGNRNAIHILANMINTLYAIKVPKVGSSKTTYNVGTISGGTSVNSIAQDAEMLYEYRSDNIECLQRMKNAFEKIIEAYRATGIEVDVELLGERPCGVDPDPEVFESLMNRAYDSLKAVSGVEGSFHSGSTDANYPLSKGIPAICIGAVNGFGAHTRAESIELDSLKTGIRFVLDFMSGYFME